MSHIIFGSFDTTGKFIIAPYEIPMPKVQTNYVSIPGRNGMLDLSESYGSVKYRDRNIAITMYAVGDYDAVVSELVNTVHGKSMNITFSKDSSFFYVGRVDVSGIAKHNGYCQITVSVNAEPYKLKQSATTKSRTGNGTLTLTNLAMPVVPSITATAPATLACTIGGVTKTFSVPTGTTMLPELVLPPGNLVVTVTTSGKVTFTYREGAL